MPQILENFASSISFLQFWPCGPPHLASLLFPFLFVLFPFPVCPGGIAVLLALSELLAPSVDSSCAWCCWNHRRLVAFGFVTSRMYTQFFYLQWSSSISWLLSVIRVMTIIVSFLLIVWLWFLLWWGTFFTGFVCCRVYTSVCQSLFSVFKTSQNGPSCPDFSRASIFVLKSDLFCSNSWHAAA